MPSKHNKGTQRKYNKKSQNQIFIRIENFPKWFSFRKCNCNKDILEIRK